MNDLDAVRTIVAALEPFERADRRRILRWVSEKLGLEDVPDTYKSKSVEEWMDDLVSHDGGVRVRAVAVIRELGSRADAAVCRLVEQLDVNEKEKWKALMPAEALLQIGRNVDEAGRLIMACFLDDNTDIRLTAFGSICKNGASAAPLVPQLIGALRHSSETVRTLAARALRAIGRKAGSEAVDALRALRMDFSEDVRRAAEEALREIADE